MHANKITLFTMLCISLEIFGMQDLTMFHHMPKDFKLSPEQVENSIIGAAACGDLNYIKETCATLSSPLSASNATSALLATINECQNKPTGPEIIKFLIAQGANPNHINENPGEPKITVMHEAVSRALKTGETTILQTLLNHGGDPIYKSGAPFTPYEVCLLLSLKPEEYPHASNIRNLLTNNIMARDNFDIIDLILPERIDSEPTLP